MRLLCLFILFTAQTILFAPGGDSLNPKQPDSISSKKREWEIVSNGLKELKIGDSPKKIYKAFAGLKIKHNKYNAYIIIDKLDTICVVWCDETNVVGSIFTRSKRFFHAGDIRVGLRVDEVIRKRPGIVMSYNDLDDEESLKLYYERKNNMIAVDLLIQSDDGKMLGVYENENVVLTSTYRTTGFIYGIIIQKVN